MTNNYSQLSNLAAIEAEKIKLREKIKKQEGKLEASWEEIGAFWCFVPKVVGVVGKMMNVIPTGLRIISFITNLLSNRRTRSKGK